MVVLCTPVLAHARFVDAEPARGAELQQAPEQVLIRFSEPVEAEFSPVEVSNSEGERVDQDNARIDPDDARVVVEDLNSDLPDGTYTVEWRVTSVDGHAIDGAYEFAVATGGGATSRDGAQTGNEEGGQAGATQGGDQEEFRSTDRILLYSVASLGVLLVVALASVAVVRARRREP